MEILEKARIDYPIGTKFRSMFTEDQHTSTGSYIMNDDDVFIKNKEGWWCIYYSKRDQWAEIIKEETMTQQEFNSLRVGEFISNYEILHKYKEFLIVRCDDGYDLVDLAKINKLGLKVTPKTFMGLEIKEYDNVPCEMDGCLLVYLTEVKDNCIFYKPSRNFKPNQLTPTSIRIL